MLERMSVKNFQSHEHTQVVFDPRITCFVGPSDAGKSALMRALRWAMTNRPTGDAIRRSGSSMVGVKLWLDGGRLITRQRTNQENSYRLDDREPYRAVATDVPPDIAALLNVDELNFQGQHDAAYWLADTPGNVAKSLNAIINLGIIDSVLSDLAAKARKAQTAEDLIRDRYAKAKEDAKGLAWVMDAEAALAAVEAVASAADAAQLTASRLAVVVDRADADRRRHTNEQRLADDAGRVVLLGKAALAGCQDAAAVACDVATAATAAKAAKLRPDFSPVAQALAAYQAAAAELDTLADLLGRAEEARQADLAAAKRATATQKELTDQTGGVCPLCEQPMPNH